MIRRWWSSLKEVLKDLFVGVLAAGLLLQAVLLFFFEDRRPLSTGLWLGVGMAIFMAWHISHTLEGAVGMTEKDAGNQIRKGFAVRFLLLILLALGIYRWEVGSVIAYFFGVMTLKFSAYLQPVIHRIRTGEEV